MSGKVIDLNEVKKNKCINNLLNEIKDEYTDKEFMAMLDRVYGDKDSLSSKEFALRMADELGIPRELLINGGDL